MCDECGLGFTQAEWDDRHWMHLKGCGAYVGGLCTQQCDLEVHARCCTQCKDMKRREVQLLEGTNAD